MTILPRFQTAPEHRLLKRGVFGNVGNVIGGSWREHVAAPVESGNIPKAALGAVGVIGDAILTAPDAALAGLVGQDIEPLKATTHARTKRDIGLTIDHTFQTIGNLLTLRWGEALKSGAKGVLDVVRLGGDIPMDIFDAAGGYDVIDRRRAQTHDQILALAA